MQGTYISSDMVPLRQATLELGRSYRSVYHYYTHGKLNPVVQRVGKQLLVKTEELAVVLEIIEAVQAKRRAAH